ncbi:unnamed protein product [Amoebophrya sp. A25]|nr:unnamed protein product [Amoebophrya sp. A25]|eukprot:GSA25T00024809001.1
MPQVSKPKFSSTTTSTTSATSTTARTSASASTTSTAAEQINLTFREDILLDHRAIRECARNLILRERAGEGGRDQVEHGDDTRRRRITGSECLPTTSKSRKTQGQERTSLYLQWREQRIPGFCTPLQMATYSRIFSFLLDLKSARKTLLDTHLLVALRTRCSGAADERTLIQSVSLLRAEMLHFVTSLESTMMSRISECAREFDKKLLNKGVEEQRLQEKRQQIGHVQQESRQQVRHVQQESRQEGPLEQDSRQQGPLLLQQQQAESKKGAGACRSGSDTFLDENAPFLDENAPVFDFAALQQSHSDFLEGLLQATLLSDETLVGDLRALLHIAVSFVHSFSQSARNTAAWWVRQSVKTTQYRKEFRCTLTFVLKLLKFSIGRKDIQAINLFHKLNGNGFYMEAYNYL